MSFKDSMLRGLALVGADSMARTGFANREVLADIIDNGSKIAR